MRKTIIAGNWKMNKTYSEGLALIEGILEGLAEQAPTVDPSGLRVILGTPFIHLKEAAEMVGDNPWVEISAQNCHTADSGAYTGEISAAMIKSADVHRVILGHSERRQYFGEDNRMLSAKVRVALDHSLLPIFCCGEVLSQREAGDHFSIVKKQLEEGLFVLDKEEFGKIVIAYEPVWAIGTGVNASPEQAQEMHAHIRGLIKEAYGEAIAESTSILYGGSLKPSNAKELLAKPDVDGGLIGGASLDAKSFIDIIRAV